MMNIILRFISIVSAPPLLWCERILLLITAILILVRCCRSLFSSKLEKEVWGFISLANGARYELIHWENSIGRAKGNDVCVNFPTVSRNHATVCRNDDGEWRVFPVNPAAKVLLNGTHIAAPTSLQNGDVINVGGVDLFFFPADAAQEAKQAEKRTKAGRTVSPTLTLVLLTFFQFLISLQLLPMAGHGNGFIRVPIAFVALCALMWGVYSFYRMLRRTAFEAETLAFFLTTMDFAVTAAYSPAALYKQFASVLLGLILFLILSLVLRNLRLAVKLRWPVTAAASALLAFNVVFGQRIFGAKNWISFGPISFQPSEFVKLAFILAGAATLDRLFARRNLIFTVLFSAFCVGCLALMSDFGTALIFFVAFLCIAFLRSGDLPSIVMISAAAAFGGAIVIHFKPYVADRFSVWLHAWEYTQSGGYQQSRTMSAIAGGGLAGAGPTDSWLKYVGAANTDLVFGVVSEEFGFLLALCMIAALVILAIFTLEAASTARSSFYTIASCATAAMLIFQTALNVLGAVDLLPLTGVTFPFVSIGGSSMSASWGLLAFLKAADTRQNASFILRLPRKSATAQLWEEANPQEAESPVQPDSFFADRPDIPVDEIFGKEAER